MPDAPVAAPSSAPVTGRVLDRRILVLAGPVLVEQVLLYLVGLSDTLLTGRLLGVYDLAAVTVCSYLGWTLGSLMVVVSAGATAIVARQIGGGDRAGAERVTAQALRMALAVGLVLLALGQVCALPIVHLLNLRGEAAAMAEGYFRIILLAKPLQALQVAGVACLRGAGDTRTGMRVMFLVNAINVPVSWAAAIGALGFPRLGLRGIALGTALGEAIGGVIVVQILLRGRAGLVISRGGRFFRGRDVARILRVSLPAFAESLTNTLCQLWFLGLINRLGPTATAAHGVAIRCESIAFLTVTAFAVAASTLTGQYLGAARPDLARRAARRAWGMGIGLLCGFGVLLFSFAGPMVRLFLGPGQSGVELLGVPVLRLIAFAMPALATINVLGGALRGAGDTRWPWLVVLFGYLGFRMPLALWATGPSGQANPGAGIFAAWVAMFVDLSVRGLALAARFLHGGWTRTRV